MENKTHSVSILEKCVVKPTATAPAEIHAPLTFLDMQWMFFNNIQRLLFYRIPNLSRSQFLEHIFPTLKQSLSLTLDRFPLVAGNLIIPPNTDSSMPEICFRNGDGVTLIFAECDDIDHFNHLVSNDERDCDGFHPLVHEFKASDQVSSTSPVLALQVTLFPGAGISVGYTFHHALGDASSIFMFMNTWSILNYNLTHNKQPQLVLELPVFDRNLIPDDKVIAKIICDQWLNLVSNTQGNNPFFDAVEKPKKVRKTFIISSEDVKKLKNMATDNVRVSSFAVISSYIWICSIKSELPRKTDGDLREHLSFLADCRERTDPVIPANYFGNCLTNLICTVSNGNELVEEGGFRMATELIATTIKEKLSKRDAVFGGEENNMEIFSKMNWGQCLTVAGSTRQNYYKMDFGWGNPVKNEIISIDNSGAVSMSGCRDSDGGVEIGLTLSVPQMNAFSAIFMEGLNL